MNVTTASGRWARSHTDRIRLIGTARLRRVAERLGGPIGAQPDAGRPAALVLVGALLALTLVWKPLPVLALAWGAIAALVAVFWAYRRPRHGVVMAVVLVLLAGTKFRERDPGLSMAGVVDAQIVFELAGFALLGLVAVLAWTSARPARERPGWVELALFAFAGFALLSACWSPIPLMSAARAVQLGILVTLAFVALRVLGPVRAVGTLHSALLAYVLTCAAITLSLPGTVAGTASLAADRFAWFAAHPLTVATLTGLAAVCVAARALFAPPGRGPLRNAVGWLWLLPLGAILLATQSRAATAAVAVSISALLLRRFTPTWMATALICVAVTAVAVFPILDLSPVDVLDRWEGEEGMLAEFVLRGQTAEEVMTLNGRMELWGALGQLIAERPVIGHGYLSSRDLVVELISWARQGSYAHNELAQTLLDFGIVGTLLFWLPFATVFSTGPLRRSSADAEVVRTRAVIFGGAAFLVLNAMTSEGLVAPPGFGLLVVCILTMAAAVLRREPTAAVPAAARRDRADGSRPAS